MMEGLAYASLAIRLGDALTNNDNANMNQYRRKMDLTGADYTQQGIDSSLVRLNEELTTANAELAQCEAELAIETNPEKTKELEHKKQVVEKKIKGLNKEIKAATEAQRLMTENPEKLIAELIKGNNLMGAANAEGHYVGYTVGGESTYGSAAFVLGEANQEYYIRPSADGKSLEIVIRVRDVSKVPLATIYAIEERYGELDTKGSAIFSAKDGHGISLIIEADADPSDPSMEYYRQYVELHNGADGTIPVELRRTSTDLYDTQSGTWMNPSVESEYLTNNDLRNQYYDFLNRRNGS
jgi:hypothetical protein